MIRYNRYRFFGLLVEILITKVRGVSDKLFCKEQIAVSKLSVVPRRAPTKLNAMLKFG